MNDEDRNNGVTEARFALTLLTCLLVAIGYIVLLRLGGAKDSSAVADPDDGPTAVAITPVAPTPNKSEPVPQVLPIDKADDGAVENTAQRPARVAPRNTRSRSSRR